MGGYVLFCAGRLGAGEVALLATDGFFGALVRDVVLGLGVAAQAGDGDAMDGGVDLAVAAAVEAVAVGPSAARSRAR
jgi:hypothetical protein